MVALAFFGIVRSGLGAYKIRHLRVFTASWSSNVPSRIDAVLVLIFGAYYAYATVRLSRLPTVLWTLWLGSFLLQPIFSNPNDETNPSLFDNGMHVAFLVFAWGVLWAYRQSFNWGLFGLDAVDQRAVGEFD